MIRTAPTYSIRFCLSLAVLTIAPAIGSSAEPATQHAAADATTAELRIDGGLIDRLILANENNRTFEFERPASSVSLPPGRYYVREVHLTGGYFGCGRPGVNGHWFDLVLETPYELKIGAPLTLNVKTSRLFRTLKLDYELNDASGHTYLDGERADLPKFTVYKGGKEIGSGSFEYG